MTTTVERFRVATKTDDDAEVYFEDSPDLTMHLMRGGEASAEYTERGIVLVTLGVDGQHDVVSVDNRGGGPHSSEEITGRALDSLKTVHRELRRLHRKQKLLRRLGAVEDHLTYALHRLRSAVPDPLHRECQSQEQLAFKLGRDYERQRLGLPTENQSGYSPLTPSGRGLHSV